MVPFERWQKMWHPNQPTWRLWGEERVDGAIYTVYLKKVRYHRPTKSVSSDSDDEISHLEWETVRVRFVKAGTLEKLVESLATDDGELESTYINVFLTTYRTFATAKQVLMLLLDRYEQLANDKLDLPEMVMEQHRKTLVLALHVWLDSYPEDFRAPPTHPTLHQLLYFCRQHLPESEIEVKVRHRLDRFSKEDQMLDSCLMYSNSSLPNFSPPALANGHSAVAVPSPYLFPDVPECHFAEQLTRMDMALFKKLVPHQCLGAIWSRRDKNRSHEAATVLATVNQFNAVSLRVISTVLMDPDIRPSERARVITTWIDIAQELRVLKNFSSLKAIISGLQSNPVYRLQRTWQAMPREKVELFEELARIFSEDNNQWAQRELLMREGTAKFADTVGENDRQLQKVFQRQLNNSGNISHGTIPYLGTFLTDLTMIDTAIPDTVMDGLINFDKRRKEFEVLAQIKLLQGAANAYNLPDDPAFDRWFDSILVLDDREAYELSCMIEAPVPGQGQGSAGTTRELRHKRRAGLGHRKNDSIASTSSSSSSQFYCDLDSLPSSPHNSLDRKASPSQMSSSSSSSSLPSLDASMSSSNTNTSAANSTASRTLTVPGQSPASKPQHDFYIIRVTVETSSVETDGIVLYKSIMLSNNERTPQVIRNAMLKLGLEGNPDSYTLAQVLPDKELVLPPNANVYYAVNTAFNLNFILRPKRCNPLDVVAPGRAKPTKKSPLAT
ncbi:ral guanine nucleotide dissociation stimulator-like 1 isoform X3 [Zootermopsis nevadensis]|uniref:ral guanine nucleotide dissociation stimulator-like 1 isoform X3 n=1 Tax=Zootermopsis nevadensis TaxID=136037 RepID=UPI000B8E883C|nr:ral guanine nucleotide dissociation stimulator-like 1 isoform X3 [Zootermopsis nevadensis]